MEVIGLILLVIFALLTWRLWAAIGLLTVGVLAVAVSVVFWILAYGVLVAVPVLLIILAASGN